MASLYTRDGCQLAGCVPVHGKQVQLKLRIVEVDRTRMDQLGVTIFAGGRTALTTSTQHSAPVLPERFLADRRRPAQHISLYNAKLNVGLTVKDLEQKQILQVWPSLR